MGEEDSGEDTAEEEPVTEGKVKRMLPGWKDLVPSWLKNFKLAIFAMAAGTGWTAKNIEGTDKMKELETLLAENPSEFIIDLVSNAVAGFIYDSVLEPLARTVWDVGVALLDGFLFVVYGSDRAIGVEPGSVLGLLDIPFVFFSPIAGFIVDFTTATTGSVDSMNSAVAQAIGAQFPIVGPVLYGGFWALEVSAAAWLAWLALNTVDIPLADVAGALKTASAPARRVFRWLL